MKAASLRNIFQHLNPSLLTLILNLLLQTTAFNFHDKKTNYKLALLL